MDDPELLAERRRLKRSRGFWRAACVLVIAGALALLVGRSGLATKFTPYVAELRLSGVIYDDTDLIEALGDAMDADAAKALVLRIDSPGGTVVGGESFYRAVRKVAETKPVVAVMGEVAASGGYMVAIAADHIVAREGTITGSIGVIMQTTDVTGLLEKLGIGAEAIKSAPLKAVPSPFEPLTAAGRAATKVLVDDMFDMFVGMVAERRGMDRAQALALADGRVFTGRQAKANGLIDELGGMDEAREWLAAKGVGEGLPMREIKVWQDEDLFGGLVHAAVRAALGKSYLPERLRLDGLVAVWHPDLRFR
ncbi:MAG: signal peptide peptidase SppA [Alphaproteobacteria bacterium]|nr:signal peptide peptidase SppA [Alphaproteobacteria bacterium]